MDCLLRLVYVREEQVLSKRLFYLQNLSRGKVQLRRASEKSIFTCRKPSHRQLIAGSLEKLRTVADGIINEFSDSHFAPGSLS